MNYELKWMKIIHPAIDNRYIDLLMIYDGDDPDPYTVGSIVEDPINSDFVWVLKGGYPYGSSPTKEQAKKECEACLVEHYLNKDLMPWQAAFLSSN